MEEVGILGEAVPWFANWFGNWFGTGFGQLVDPHTSTSLPIIPQYLAGQTMSWYTDMNATNFTRISPFVLNNARRDDVCPEGLSERL